MSECVFVCSQFAKTSLFFASGALVCTGSMCVSLLLLPVWSGRQASRREGKQAGESGKPRESERGETLPHPLLIILNQYTNWT